LDVKIIFAGSHTEHRWRCSKGDGPRPSKIYSSFHYYFLPKTKQRAFQVWKNKGKGFSSKAETKQKGGFLLQKDFSFLFCVFFLGVGRGTLILAKASYLGKETTIEKEGSVTNEWSTKGESSIL